METSESLNCLIGITNSDFLNFGIKTPTLISFLKISWQSILFRDIPRFATLPQLVSEMEYTSTFVDDELDRMRNQEFVRITSKSEIFNFFHNFKSFLFFWKLILLGISTNHSGRPTHCFVSPTQKDRWRRGGKRDWRISRWRYGPVLWKIRIRSDTDTRNSAYLVYGRSGVSRIRGVIFRDNFLIFL